LPTAGRHDSPQSASNSPDSRHAVARIAIDTGLVNRNEERTMWTASRQGTWWSVRGEASLNWLALGVLLAAWNASDDDSSRHYLRPEALRRYPCVSVRAATLHVGELRGTAMNR